MQEKEAARGIITHTENEVLSLELERSKRRPEHRQPKRKKGIAHPFRWLACILAIAALVLAVKVPVMSADREAEAQQLSDASDAYWEAQNENNRLSQQVAESNTKDFVERVARRDYGYCVYGETIYTVSNLDELLADESVKPELTEEVPADPETQTDSAENN